MASRGLYFRLLLVAMFVKPAVAWLYSGSTVKPVNLTGFVSKERELFTNLMTDYNPAVRPSVSAGAALPVKVQLMFLKVLDLDEKKQTLNTQGWLHKSWYDFQLKWEPGSHEGLEYVRLPRDRVWTPDIILYNTASDSYRYVIDKLVVVRFDGTVHWVPHANFKSHCKLDLTRFPFDTQECRLYFGSSTYDLTQMDVQIDKNISKEFVLDSLHWDLVDQGAQRLIFNVSKNEKISIVKYTLKFKRQNMFQRTMFVGPAVLLTMLVVFMFLIPPQAGERLTLGVGVVISCTVMLLLLDSHLPANMASDPVIGMYFIFTFIMATMAVLTSIGVINCHFRRHRQGPVPNWIRRLFLSSFSRFCCVQGMTYFQFPKDDTQLGHALTLSPEDLSDTSVTASSTEKSDKVLDEIRMCLKQLNEKNDFSASHQELVINEWHQVALLTDRIMFWLYLLVSILVTMAMLHP